MEAAIGVYHLIRYPATALILPGFPASLHDIPEIPVAGHRKEIFFQRLSHAPGDLELFGEQHKPGSGDHQRIGSPSAYHGKIPCL